MVAMAFMVFGHVVLRYGFNFGIDISDEMARYFFIWFTYIGATLAKREKGHLGICGKKLCLFLSEALMLTCNLLFFIGTWRMHELQASNVSPVVGISMIWIYGVGYVAGLVMVMMNLHVLYRLLSGQLREDELIQEIENEGLTDVEKQLEEAKA